MSDSFNFIKGQRFISQTEQELGLGTVIEFNHRMIQISFDSANETRIYSKQNAPISRILFAKDDVIPSKMGWKLTVTSVQQLNGLAIYQGINDKGEETLLPETEISGSIKLDRPTERLFSGHLDSNKWFELRQLAIDKIIEVSKNPLHGLIGCRTSLLKHQLYIAHSVAKRFAPRVLLADEVGLGKTIEAGMILHQQLLKNRAKRVVIVVPESLIHQWMVEMLRRFNLHFSVYDEHQCLAIEESSGLETPFESSQLALVSLEFLVNTPSRAQQLSQTPWDLLVVDEAHHLNWQPDHASDEYVLIEKLAQKIPGVLLLTATPEQLGKQGHFARLRLLDPHKFTNFNDFELEESNYQSLVTALDKLTNLDSHQINMDSLDSKLFDPESLKKVQALSTSETISSSYELKNELIGKLLDQHGTGRILFRNTRSAIQGFPERKVHHYPIENTYPDLTQLDIKQQICPELTAGPNWYQQDSRFSWLLDKVQELKNKKILLIAANKSSILDLAAGLRIEKGIHAAVFHEDLTLIERDQAAAWFADLDEGAQIMLCSEIGSEGRNFQFAHHAIFFDLPINPDLLEQRIGRLDRIGQNQTIHLHIPYLKNTACEKLFQWHHMGLNLFAQICPAAYSVYSEDKDELIQHLQGNTNDKQFESFINRTQIKVSKKNQDFNNGRDRLLEYNSCRPIIAEELLTLAQSYDDTSCQQFMHKIFDLYGVHYEDLRNHVELIKPSESLHGHFPYLIEDGMSVTFDRQTALSNETLHYLTWEHPMVVESMEMLATEEKGNVTLVTLRNSRFKPSTILIETNFNFEVVADAKLQIARFLPNNSLRILLDENQNVRTEMFETSFIQSNTSSVPHNVALQIIKMKQAEIKNTIKASESIATTQVSNLIESCLIEADDYLSHEIDRLSSLSQLNSNVRDDEINFFQEQKHLTLTAIKTGQIKMNGIRILVCI
jgi:ATP-dependent helicase HepA